MIKRENKDCDYKGTTVKIERILSRPKLSGIEANRQVDFKCSKSDECDLYQNHECPYAKYNK